MRSRTLAAHEWIAREVVRIRDAGEPITTEDCHAFQLERAETQDSTAYWLNAIDELHNLDEKQLLEEGKSLPVVGNASDDSIRPDAVNSRFADVVAFLEKHHAVLRAVRVAMAQPGKCSFPVAFEDGINARLDHVQSMRSIARLLKLQLCICAYQKDWDGALESLDALVAASETLNHQPVTVQYLVSLAVAGVAAEQAAFLLNENSLTDHQLARMQAILTRLDPKGGLTIALYGERAMGYHAFHHLGLMVGGKASSLHQYDGQLIRPVDCQTYLAWSRELIDYSKKDFPLALDLVQQFDGRIKVLMKRPIERLWHIQTLLLFPATPALFEACAKSMARKEIAIIAVAAERFRIENATRPKELSDLVPQFLPAVPADPFSGNPLLMKHDDKISAIYSVGVNRVDDRGVGDASQGEPDIVFRLRSQK